MNNLLREISKCRVCNGEQLQLVPSLGYQEVVSFPENNSEVTYTAPLDLVLCGICGLLQLKFTFNRDILYKRYWYRSGISALMISSLADIVNSAIKCSPLSAGDIVIDIGANDGTLLKQYHSRDIIRVGFEPSQLYELNDDPGILMINDYFNYHALSLRIGEKKARIITSVAMFYDLDDPNSFVSDVVSCLDEKGVWIIQMNYLGSMIENNTFDNISHEHLEYYSLTSLIYLLNRHNLAVVKVEINDVNGGSFRVFVRFKNLTDSSSEVDRKFIHEMLAKENNMGLMSVTTFQEYIEKINSIGSALKQFLTNEKEKGKRLCIYGASTRGLVILQYFKIDHGLFDFAVDKNPDKWGRYMVGTDIIIYSHEKLVAENPDYMFLLPYHLVEEIKKQEESYLLRGGTIITPLPLPALITSGKTEMIA